MHGYILSPKIVPSHGAMWTPSNTWNFLEPTRAHNPDGMSIGSAVFAGSRLRQTDRQTDHAIHGL